MNKIMTFRTRLLAWYSMNARPLPWRETRDPYRIWISEMILQQTRINQGMGYYQRFLERFPDIQTLADAEEEEVLKMWQGLGYYSRARNLHRTAKEILSSHHGSFPEKHEEMIRLKGIGEYTAAAILSIAFDRPYPVVDGNVFRFFSRHFGVYDRVDTQVGKRRILELMRTHMDESKPGSFNQAVMEFGALQCIPVNPGCPECLFKKSCVAIGEGNVDRLPARKGKKSQKERYFNYFVIRWKDKENRMHLCLRKREDKDIWMNLYDFPMIETPTEFAMEKLTGTREWDRIIGGSYPYRITRGSNPGKHILTHQVINARFYFVDIEMDEKPDIPFPLLKSEEIAKYPVPRLIDEFLLKNRDIL